MSKVIGIDLGTANSCVAIIVDGLPQIVCDSEGYNTVPSVFAINANQEPVVGRAAVLQAENNPLNTIFAVKRLIGQKYASEEVKEAHKKLPYKILEAPNGDAWVEVNGEPLSPEQVSSQVLVKMKEIAEEHLKAKVHRAVITVPAHFNDAQRQATKDAGKIAGLEVLRIINEPTAAALAYGLDKLLRDQSQQDPAKRNKDRYTVAVFDLGGGTFDISILAFKDGVFDVLATNGDTYLGGEDIDLAIVNHLIEEFRRSHGIDVSADKLALQRLKTAARDAKHALTDEVRTNVRLPFIGQGGASHIDVVLERKMLERIVNPILQRMEEPCLTAMEDANLRPGDIDEVILVGGMTRMPAVKKYCARVFGKEPLDTVNPDEAVAAGAAIQGGLLEGIVRGVSLFDVTSLTLGIETQGGTMTPLIPRNTKIPSSFTEIFTTSAPNQPQVSIHILQGESDFAPDNKTLGRFELMGIRPASRGVPQIAVTFDIDAEGIVQVSARDLDTGLEQEVEIVASSGLDDTEIDKLLRENQLLEQQKDRKQSNSRGSALLVNSGSDSETAELSSQLKQLIFTTQFRLDAEGKGYKGAARKELEASLTASRQMLERPANAAELTSSLDSLKEQTLSLDEFLDVA